MVKGLAHVCLGAADLAAVEKFYCAGLGFKKAFNFVRGGQVIGFYLEASRGNYIEVFRHDTIDAAAKGLIQHFCLEVDDIDEAGRQLAAHGYPAGKKILGKDHGWQMWTTDPSGVKIELQQYTERSCQFTHENCVLD
jgi:catechol 2,3-dioxygenase-like lactoylglutathione lyase family enzyme